MDTEQIQIATFAVMMLGFLTWVGSSRKPRQLFIRYMTEDGYVRKKSVDGKDQAEHREIAEAILQRKLKPWEVVHHINGRRSDNRPKNLCMMTKEDHERYHAWYDWVYNNYKKYPRRETQLRKLREDFRGTLLSEVRNMKIG
jgi:hypothetical protein